jgi:hypothetical protein
MFLNFCSSTVQVIKRLQYKFPHSQFLRGDILIPEYTLNYTSTKFWIFPKFQWTVWTRTQGATAHLGHVLAIVLALTDSTASWKKTVQSRADASK